MTEYTIILLEPDTYIGLLHNLAPNLYTMIHRNGTISGTLDITTISYSVISTHNDILELSSAMDQLI